MTESDAVELIDKTEASRSQFIRKLFNADINDPHQYDMVVNTSYIDIEDLLETVILAINAKFTKLRFIDREDS